ncbi:MAG: glycosyltransferase family 39 protein [Steroidobacteraceae bacterium]
MSDVPTQPAFKTQTCWLLLALIAGLWFATLGTRHLLNPDEGRYAEIASEMLTTGDWITPRLNGIKYFEKPPLQYWMTAAAYQVFGQTEFAARFWTGLTGFAGLLLAGFTTLRLFGRSAAAMTIAVLASSLLYVVIGHINTLDMGLSFFLQLAISSFLLAQQSTTVATERNWMLGAWASVALAFLSKGLVALILPALTLIAYTLVTREYSAWRRLHIGKGLLLLLVLGPPWLVAVSRTNTEFLQFFFLHEQFERFLTTIHDRAGPWWYFLPLLLLGTLPWTFVALRQFKPAWQLDSQLNGFQTRRFLMLWIVVVVTFFSLSHSKLPPYIVPVIPMFAMLLGDIFTRLSVRALRMHLLVMGSVLTLLAVMIGLLPTGLAGTRSVDLIGKLQPPATIGFLLAAAAMLFSAWQLRRSATTHTIPRAVITTGLGTLLALNVLIQGSNEISATRSGYALAQQIKAAVPDDLSNLPIYSVSNYDQTLPFYLQRRITLVNYRGELDFGLTQEPELAIDSIEAFARVWNQPGSAIAVMSPALYTEMLSKGLPMRLIAEQAKMVAVGKP